MVDVYILRAADSPSNLYELELTIKGLEAVMRLHHLRVKTSNFNYAMLSSAFAVDFYKQEIAHYIVSMIGGIYDKLLKTK